jgi:hypothetical protein
MTSRRLLLAVAMACGLSMSGIRAAGSQAAVPPVAQPFAQPVARLALPEATRTPASLSADGRYIALESAAPLVPGDDNADSDIYVLDRITNRLTLESVAFDGRAATAPARGRV